MALISRTVEVGGIMKVRRNIFVMEKKFGGYGVPFGLLWGGLGQREKNLL